MLDGLDPEFYERLLDMMQMCDDEKIKVIPYQGVRTPHEQAQLWRRGRSTSIIEEKISQLKVLGADYLAKLIEDAGPQQGSRVTNAIPGFSWHQWGEACDFYVQDEGGKPVWDSANEGYQIMCECAEEAGLVSGHRWKMKDSVHVQLRPDKLSSLYSLKEINEKMRNTFNV